MARCNVQPRMPRFGRSELKYAIVEPPRIDIRLAKLSREHLHLQRKDSSNARPKETGIDLLFAYPPNIFEVHIARLRCATPEHRRPASMSQMGTPNWAGPVDVSGSPSTATRFTSGAICLSSSSHFPLMLYSNSMKPVALPPGLARCPPSQGLDLR